MKKFIVEDLDENIKIERYPLSYLYILIIKRSELNISDKKLYIIIKILFKYHSNIFILYNIKQLYFLINDCKQTIILLDEIYNFLKKLILFKKKKKKYEIIKNIKISKDRRNFIKDIEQKFLSGYDLCYNTIPYFLKIDLTLPYCHINEIKIRLEYIYSLFGIKFFLTNKIKILLIDDFKFMNQQSILKYFSYVYAKILKIFKFLNNFDVKLNKFSNYLNKLIELDIEYFDI